MSKRMLIDSAHPEETRVVVLDGQKVEEFDFEAASKRPLKGNIYLAKVTRVEPSLQAAFVEYGGNRQGFLAFSEIHPDYYQIPFEDRQALLAEQEAEARRREEDEIESFEMGSSDASDEDEEAIDAAGDETPPEFDDEFAVGDESANPDETEATAEEGNAEDDRSDEHVPDGVGEENAEKDEAAAVDTSADAAEQEQQTDQETPAETVDHGDDVDAPTTGDEPEADDVAKTKADGENGDDAAEASEDRTEADEDGEHAQPLATKRPSQKFLRRKHYKIQEVIKRRQIILVQVVKEERGNKGAALTTYLSLAGRYCVLMPNTPRGGGISRKITNMADRKRLKSAAQALELPEGMGLIVRTAGANRTKLEIRRDYEYLLRLWDTIRETTLKSNAPACVYEEGDLIKRVIRDLYNKDVEEILVEGKDGYRNARDFMSMLMPSHAKNVKQYDDAVPLYQRHHIEQQLDSMFTPTVTLKSGGYIVINQTEALVSIDVNSGRATKEHNIEETARKTNLEAADEIGRQLRLRDLAGLIVIDFIDMEDGRNDREVEKRMHNAVKKDRARVQIGKISQFGLLEMSRQRLRAGVVAGSTVSCPHCGGHGIIRSVESNALRVLRAVEEEAAKKRSAQLNVSVAADVAIYILNQKRGDLTRIESDHDLIISFEPSSNPLAGHFEIERIGQRAVEEKHAAVSVEAGFAGEPIPEDSQDDDSDEAFEAEEDAEEAAARAGVDSATDASQDDEESKPRRRRRRRRGGRNRNGANRQEAHSSSEDEAAADQGSDQSADEDTVEAADGDSTIQKEGGNNRRRRRRRRGRRGHRDGDEGHTQTAQEINGEDGEALPSSPDVTIDRFGDADDVDTTPREEPAQSPNAQSSPVWDLQPSPQPTEHPAQNDASQQPRKGWWQRTFRTDD